LAFLLLETTTTATALLAGTIGGDGGDVLNAADLHAGTGQSAEGVLGTGSGGLGSVSSDGAELDVESGDAESLDLLGDVLSGQHSGVGRRLVTIGFDLHAAGNAAKGFPLIRFGHKGEKRAISSSYRIPLVPRERQ